MNRQTASLGSMRGGLPDSGRPQEAADRQRFDTRMAAVVNGQRAGMGRSLPFVSRQWCREPTLSGDAPGAVVCDRFYCDKAYYRARQIRALNWQP